MPCWIVVCSRSPASSGSASRSASSGRLGQQALDAGDVRVHGGRHVVGDVLVGEELGHGLAQAVEDRGRQLAQGASCSAATRRSRASAFACAACLVGAMPASIADAWCARRPTEPRMCSRLHKIRDGRR